MSIGSTIDGILTDFTAISLEEVQTASLMQRRDRKYVFGFLDLPLLLSRLIKEYDVLEINGIRAHDYKTFYYDTANLEMYHMHHRGMANRHKIRFRKYGTSDLHFLEVKKKNAKGITIKNRIKTEGMDASILDKEEEFLLSFSPYVGNGMELVMENSFNRITLVSHSKTERITLDYNLCFKCHLSKLQLELPGISIAEIKYENHLTGSPFSTNLRNLRITPRRFSKYAIGMALLNADLKQNLFKEQIRHVHKINTNFLQTVKP